LEGERGDGEGRERGEGIGREVIEGEEDLDERGKGEGARDVKSIDDSVEGRILMGVGLEDGVFGLGDEV
jgi:hypothetical protein